MNIDTKTKILYDTLKAEGEGARHRAWPELLCEMALEEKYEKPTRNYGAICRRYDGHRYGEWYRCLAFITFGYGNYSNNDRRRNGLPARRKSRSWRND